LFDVAGLGNVVSGQGSTQTLLKRYRGFPSHFVHFVAVVTQATHADKSQFSQICEELYLP
jgi:hypothetical protein